MLYDTITGGEVSHISVSKEAKHFLRVSRLPNNIRQCNDIWFKFL